MKETLLAFTALASGSMLLCSTSTAHAQQSPGWGVSEIIVTAQKRAQNLQDVPASVTALTADSLAVNRVDSIFDLDSVTPNLTLTNVPAGNTSPTFSMRGVIGLGTAPGADKGIALYVDGVYVGSGSGSGFDIADIERIEVLKGPQGTLFGRNVTGGAISITTRDPAGEFHVKQQAGFGNYDQISLRTRIDTPQIGPLSGALTYFHTERRGDIRNKGAGTVWNGTGSSLPPAMVSPKWLGDDDADSWAAAIKLEASPDFTLTYKFDHTKDDFSEIGVGLLEQPTLARNGAGGAALGALNAGSGFPNVPALSRPDAVNNWATVPSQLTASGHVLTANWRVSDSLNLKNIVAYRKSRYYGPLNQLDGLGGLFAAPGVPFFGVVTLSGGHDSQWSEELQVDYDSKLMHITSGGLWYRQKNEKGGAGTGYNSINFLTAPGFRLPVPSDAPRKLSDVTVRSYAFYAHGEFHVTDQVDVIGGARYTDDKKRGTDRTIPTIGTLDYDGNKWTYDFGVNYKPTSDILIYGKYATGYISGGRLATLDYAPETAKSWEGGVKADWLDRRLRTNLSLFSAKYGNLQVAGSGLTFGVPAASQVLVNAGDAKAKGFELEATAVPIQAVTLTANVGYLDFKYTRLDPRYVAAGNTLATQRPKWTGMFAAQYVSPPVFGDAHFNLRGDANYRAAHDGSGNILFRNIGRIPKSLLLNGRLALEDIALGSAKGSVAVWGKNLTNEDHRRYILGLGVVYAASYEPARTFGVDFTVEF